MRIYQKGFNFEQDGPGNRLVYHLQGCNMRCIWCSNPEGMNSVGGEEIKPEEIVAECVSAKPLFFSNGGVTFTGGEATLWHDELKEVLCALKKNQIHTAIETNGTSLKLCELLPLIDYLIMDFKHYDGEILLKFTGKGNSEVKENFARICQSKRQLHIRIPLIKGVNTENPSGFTELFKQHDTENVVFEFLPYHEYGKVKWKEDYQVKDGFISEETLKHFKEEFRNTGLKVITT